MDKCIHHLFEEQVLLTPDSVAVEFEGHQLTYQELDNRSSQLANYLAAHGVRPDCLVGIFVDRSLETIMGILGILKAGGAYVPLDPNYPQERIKFMLQDTQVLIVLTQSHLVSQLPKSSAQVIVLDTEWEQIQYDSVSQRLKSPLVIESPPTRTNQRQDIDLTKSSQEQIDRYRDDDILSDVTAENLAYVMYTSGSTGQPKGVSVVHRGVVRLVKQTNYVRLTTAEIFLQLAPISFDASTLEIWGCLLNGGKLIIPPPQTLSIDEIGQIIQQHQVNILWLTAGLFHAIVDTKVEMLQPLKQLLAGGDVLSVPHVEKFLQTITSCQLINGYGPTENTTFTCCYPITLPIKQGESIPIGQAISQTQVYILDDELQPVAAGIAGELYIGGDGLARGYLNQPELTAAKFIPNPFDLQSRLYKTGDLVRYLPDRNIEFLGRIDHQVKIRGFRIELGEIERAIAQHSNVRENVVLARSRGTGEKQLVAYLVLHDRDTYSLNKFRDFLQQRLPDYLIPAIFILLESLPLTPNGKVDRHQLPAPSRERPQLEQAYIAPRTDREQLLTNIWVEILEIDRVGIDDNFFDLGGTSILILQVAVSIQQKLGIKDLPIVKLFQHSTIAKLAKYLDNISNPLTANSVHQIDRLSTDNDGIAIVGMVGRFPGAKNIDELWHNLCAGIESTTFFTDAQLDPSIDPQLVQDPSYVKARGMIEGGETFDAAFFGINPREAEVMDPQARVFLELVVEALENAGYTPDKFAGLIGLYAGCGQNTYFAKHICGRQEIIDRVGEFPTMLANEKDFLTTRAAYKLNLTGPTVTVSTACSTSLVAVSQAFQSLISHQCDLAVAGGISLTTPQNSGYLAQAGGMLSGDGHCRPFDADCQGTMFNNGAGLVVLKRAAEAIADGDRIYAVIRGVGVNNDGADKVSFTAPSVAGQAQAIAMAQASADFPADSISYIETHGTATPLGDPIEIAALTQAFRLQTDAKQFCAIGSIKSNFGHVVAAAGVAGLIKTALALYHKQIPASLNFASPNPQLDLADSPFYVNTQLVEWVAGATPRRAGVSSFGVGGTNAHVVLEEAPPATASGDSRPGQLLLLSAKTETALAAASVNLQKHLTAHPEINLADVAYTLNRGRQTFNYRRCIVAGNVPEAIARLSESPRGWQHQSETRDRPIVFMFPGQGAQYVNMGRNLYDTEPVFRAVVDRCAEILKPLLGKDLREIIYPDPEDLTTAEIALKQTLFTQPALFVTEYALAQLWQSWGVQPAATIGHSIGEFVSACLAGVFSLADALMLVAARGRLMWDLPGGSMLSVRLSAAEMEARLTGNMTIAAINSPTLCVVAGETEQIDLLRRQLEAEEIACRELHTSHAFHSPMMDGIIAPFAEIVSGVKLSPPQIPFVSTVTGDWITDKQATDSLYWATHLRQTVRFADGIQTIWQQPARILLEVGPRTTTTTLARQQAKDLQQQIAISSLSDHHATEWTALLQAVGQLWLHGGSIDWHSFYQQETRSRIPLPTYPFDRQRYWIDPPVHPDRLKNALQPIDPPVQFKNIISEPPVPAMSANRNETLIQTLKAVIEETSGLEMTGVDESMTFLEMGLDSLSLTQVGLALKKKFKVKVTLRQLLEIYPSYATLADFLAQTLPPEMLPANPAVVVNNLPVGEISDRVHTNGSNGSNGSKPPEVLNGNGSKPQLPMPTVSASGVENLIAQQLQIMAQQLVLLGVNPPVSSSPSLESPTPSTSQAEPTPSPSQEGINKDDELLVSRIKLPTANKSQSKTLTPQQRSGLDKIIQTYTQKTGKSKEFAQAHRVHLADPRTAAGFNPLMKEMVYPIVVARSSGAKLWDLDENEYIDLSNGFGLNLFGWSPPFVTQAIEAQLKLGMEIGPQTPLVGEVAKLMCEMTNFDRAAFCNTGSEAVLAAMRMARTITGRNLIAIFSGAYHGMFDEVIVRGSKKLRSIPAAPGIPPEMVENIVVIDYDSPDALAILASRADELAGVMVESVQSRRPEYQPIELLRQLRTFTEQLDIPLIFDEVVTGFRIHPGGAQAHFGIKADIATYGKIVGGGLPIGVVAGTAKYLDALDGGWWEFGDDSIPEVGVTYFAGTFVRHPLALAAAKAVLTHLKESGPSLQQDLNAKTDRFVGELMGYFQSVQAPFTAYNFGSLFMVKYAPDFAYGDLLFYLLRSQGVHIWDGRPCFLTTAHTDADLVLVMAAFQNAIAQLQAAGFLAAPPKRPLNPLPSLTIPTHPPHPDAKLGRDPQGNPAWYIPDPQRQGKYLQIAGVSH